MIERLLTDAFGISWDEVDEEAERIEHAQRRGSWSGASCRRAATKRPPGLLFYRLHEGIL